MKTDFEKSRRRGFHFSNSVRRIGCPRSLPPDGHNHSNYSKRAMALDQVEVMRQLGFDKFGVIGHDRGGRVGIAWRSIIRIA
jgi:pimeloyl-ACP methyl ester carboxylesterase